MLRTGRGFSAWLRGPAGGSLGAARQRHPVLAVCLHALGGEGPHLAVEVDLVQPRQAYLARPRRRQQQELKRQLGCGGRSRRPDRRHGVGDLRMGQLRTHVSEHASLAPELCGDPFARVVGPVLHGHGPTASRRRCGGGPVESADENGLSTPT